MSNRVVSVYKRHTNTYIPYVRSFPPGFMFPSHPLLFRLGPIGSLISPWGDRGFVKKQKVPPPGAQFPLGVPFFPIVPSIPCIFEPDLIGMATH